LRSRWRVVGLCLLGITGGVAYSADGGSVAALNRALAVQERRDGAASPHLLPLLERLAGAQFYDGDLSEATALRRRALKIAVIAFGSDSADAGAAMTALAEVEIDQHRYLDAEPLLIAAANIMPARLSAQSPVMSAILSGLARIALARGEPKPAEAWANRAVAIAEHGKAARSSGPLRVLGAVYAAQERFEEGEQALNTALARDRAKHGDNIPEAARTLAQLGNLRLRQKRFAEALAPIEEAIAIDQRTLGPTHPLIADDFCDLGLVYEGLGRTDDAALALSFAIDLLERGAGKDTPRVAYAEMELTRILRVQHRDDDADTAFADARRILKAADQEERNRERQI